MRASKIVVGVLSLMLMAGVWILLVAGTKIHEMILGAGTVLATSAFLIGVQRTSRLSVKLRLRDVATGWRVPMDIAADLWRMTCLLFRDLLLLERAGSFYRVCGFRTSRRDPVMVARRALATGYTSASPNTIVLDIDYAQSKMLFHQLQRQRLSKVTKQLGARP